MNLRQLRYFCEVVEAGNARAAAQKLFVAPTAISMQMAQLEERLGGPLFDRSSRPMALTALGQFVYPKARELLADAQRLQEEALGIATGHMGWLAIGFTRSTIYSVLPAAVRSMKAAFPKVRIDLVEVLSEHQAESLRSGAIHVGISRLIGDGAPEPDLVATELFADPMIAALPLESAFAGREAITAAELATLPFISYPKDPSSHFSRHALRLLEAAGAQPAVGYEAIEIHTALGLVAAGLGATVVGRSVAAHNRSDVRFVTISDLATTMRVFALRKGNAPHLLADAFLRFLLEQSAQLA
jgi:DNA-binding transcriptional LysR family regulator